MRYLSQLILATLLASSCSNEEKILLYTQELEKSKEALQEVIQVRKMMLDQGAMQNPSKNGYWKTLADKYLTLSTSLVETSFDSLAVRRDLIEKIDSLKTAVSHWNGDRCSTDDLLLHNDRQVFEHRMLLHQNCMLDGILRSTLGEGFKIVDQLVPYRANIGDTTVNMFFFNIEKFLPKFAIEFENPAIIKSGLYQSLAMFLVEEPYQDSVISGKVLFVDPQTMQAEELDFQFDSSTRVLEDPFLSPQ